MKPRRRANNKQQYIHLTIGFGKNMETLAPNRKTRRALQKQKKTFVDIRELLG